MTVFKFGGASVNSADAVRNMAAIVRGQGRRPLVVVVSAMGKTTNMLEQLVPGVCPPSQRAERLRAVRDYHMAIARDLMADASHPLFDRLDTLFAELEQRCDTTPSQYNYDYDQTVSYGELLSTTIVSHYLQEAGIANRWVDVRQVITTDSRHREGNVDWTATRAQARRLLLGKGAELYVTQGFIAATRDGHTTTLGREGSDYSAAVISHCLDADEMVIWKDVPGFLNADPKFFKDTVKIEQIPYNEAIELAYYGASVIHPKTVKPLQNKSIKLRIKSFIDPSAPGSTVGNYDGIRPLTPLYIFKNKQVLISIQPRDFSFIAEENLQTIFATLAALNIRVNLMQNTALSFSVCLDDRPVLVDQLTERLKENFNVRYNRDLQLITIRYYTPEIIAAVVAGRNILLEQRTRSTAQLVVQL
ncbi:MAG: aspartate kinase [bacterium P3]|nr:MAG: aspartate kinase [bacterium P3]KWW41061.1 MAG: aspartate kinase [bacterium F083]